MTRGEEIIIQSYDYGKYLLDTGFSTEEAALNCMRVAFIDGARWADSSVLHKATQVDLSPKGRLHNIWRGMRQRCYNPKATGFKYYGGRGIKVGD